MSQKTFSYSNISDLDEDRVWRQDIAPLLERLPRNVREIWQYGFTEMFNNAIDHSEANLITVDIEPGHVGTQIAIRDDGVGIFQKIKDALHLEDEHQAILELSKGKLTTEPSRHSGQGFFFTSRMFDYFSVRSGESSYIHERAYPEDLALRSKAAPGTSVTMMIENASPRTPKEIFDQFCAGDDYAFDKTIVQVHRAQYGDDKLVSRSQAKRLLARLDSFVVAVFDFTGVESIGQAFADEIFRVFASQHPEMALSYVSANPEVDAMIQRALHTKIGPS